jgi:hypothetical protein
MGNVNYAATSDTSKISTEMMVDDYPLLEMDIIDAAPSDSPVYVGTIQSCNNYKRTHDVSLELYNEVEDPIYIASLWLITTPYWTLMQRQRHVKRK